MGQNINRWENMCAGYIIKVYVLEKRKTRERGYVIEVEKMPKIENKGVLFEEIVVNNPNGNSPSGC